MKLSNKKLSDRIMYGIVTLLIAPVGAAVLIFAALAIPVLLIIRPEYFDDKIEEQESKP